MTTPPDPASADPYLAELISSLIQDDRIVGLVLAGSSADWRRRDAWSDHDFLVVTVPGVQEHFRTDLGWLPNHLDIGWSFRETAHGLKVLYRSGLLIEFAIFDRAEFAQCALHHFRVVIDRPDPGESDQPSLTALAAQVRSRSEPSVTAHPLTSFRHFLSLVYVGTGRARRGERLSANVFLRDHAAAALLRLVRVLAVEGSEQPEGLEQLDGLDPWRRVERVWPTLAARLDATLTEPVELVGPALLEIAATELPERWSDYPSEDLALVRALLSDE